MISLIGIIGVIVNVFFGYETVTPAITPAVSGGVLLQYLAYASVPVTIVVGFAIYGVSYYYRKSKGVPLNKIFSEIRRNKLPKKAIYQLGVSVRDSQ